MDEAIAGALLDTAILDRIISEMPEKAARIIEVYGWKITSEAAGNAPVDTGALCNSITSESGMKEALRFIVQDGVNYGVFQELGTSKMAAQPFVVPAIEHNAQEFIEAFKALFP